MITISFTKGMILMIKNIIFDVDGTLLETKEVGLLALQKTLKDDYQIDKTIAELEFAFSSTAKQVFNGFNIPEEQHATAAQSVMKNAFEFINEVQTFDGIPELLAQLKARQINLIIVTSEDQQEFKAIFQQTAINSFFNQAVTADQVDNPKPDPEPTKKALQLLQANSSETLFIGDSRSDIGSAHGANVAFGLAGWGANEKDDFSDAEYLFQQPADVLKVL
ncbi:HAD family hydrolase [Bombilactobacillus thymidiniphilus]|uniref:HAD family hydrolase n=1 Tax=Bombilactobacillus thymidiniphilus TaxID=2923363 RepID=A0ABY4PC08_9LACO|nr:HAD family hydrolase [Bombilactobacillus thymidiniphilus]UQS83198.1 HAD family hydrolase [Bombilactobacillus thymidiniphilus]